MLSARRTTSRRPRRIMERGTPSTFLSTPSARRATGHLLWRCAGCPISIHALREEGDARRAWPSLPPVLFLSTPSARRATCCCENKQLIGDLFLSTPSARRATNILHDVALAQLISIHALREEGDSMRFSNFALLYPFLSTPSARRATVLSALPATTPGNFYPRPPRGGRR